MTKKTYKNVDKKFYQYVIAILLVTVGVVILLFLFFKGDDNKLGSIGSILQGSIGVAVSLAGAIVAIRIANLGTDIVEREVRRDDLVKFNEILMETTTPFKELANSLTNFFVSAKMLNNKIKELVNKTLNNPDYDSKETVEKLVSPMLSFDEEFQSAMIKSIEEIANRLSDITKSPYSFYLWKYITNKRKTQFKNHEAFCLTEFPYNQINLDKELHDLIQMLRVRVSILKKKNFERKDIIFAFFHTTCQILGSPYLRSIAEQAEISRITKIQTNKRNSRILATAESFISLGYLLWNEENIDKNLKLPADFRLYSNIGSSLIHDIILCIPNESDINEFVSNLFKEIFEVNSENVALIRLLKEMGTSFWYSGELKEILGIVQNTESWSFNKYWSSALVLINPKKAFEQVGQMKNKVAIEKEIDNVVKWIMERETRNEA